MMAEEEITLCRVLLDRLCFKNDLDEATQALMCGHTHQSKHELVNFNLTRLNLVT